MTNKSGVFLTPENIFLRVGIVTTAVAKITTVLILNSTVVAKFTTAITMRQWCRSRKRASCVRACGIVISTFYPAHPAYPTPKVKNLTCEMSGMSGLFLAYNNYCDYYFLGCLLSRQMK